LFLSKQNIVIYFTNGQLKTVKTGTQSYAEHSRVSIPCFGHHFSKGRSAILQRKIFDEFSRLTILHFLFTFLFVSIWERKKNGHIQDKVGKKVICQLGFFVTHFVFFHDLFWVDKAEQSKDRKNIMLMSKMAKC
jgi:hypothetical protein